ncbi:D-ribose ABC transporter substrate-binding protein [Dactylosporangium fulvum]
MRSARTRIAALFGSGVLALTALTACSMEGTDSPASAASGSCDPKKLVIGYVNPSVTNQGWIIIGQGATDAAKDRGVKLRSFGPPKDGDAAGQVTVVQDVIAGGANAIALAPVDSSALVPAVKEANAAGVPVVNLDSQINGGDLASFVATDNYAAAQQQAEAVAEHIGGKGKVILINGSQAYSTGRDRRNGFVDTMKKKYPGVTVLEVQTEWDAQAAQKGLEDLLAANPDVVAVANAWDGSTVAAVPVLKSHGKRIFLVGFDGAPDAIALMEQGKVDAIVAQQLYKMGYTAIDTAVKAACGETVEKRIDTGSVLLTPDNVAKFIDSNPPILREFIKKAS